MLTTAIQAQTPGLRLAGRLGPRGVTLLAHDEAAETFIAVRLRDDGRAQLVVADVIDGELVLRCAAAVDTLCAVNPYAPHRCPVCDAGPLDEHDALCPMLEAFALSSEAA